MTTKMTQETDFIWNEIFVSHNFISIWHKQKKSAFFNVKLKGKCNRRRFLIDYLFFDIFVIVFVIFFKKVIVIVFVFVKKNMSVESKKVIVLVKI